MSNNPRLYGSRPILVSGTCKREDAAQHAVLLGTALEAIIKQQELIGGWPLCIASDGESRRGAAFVKLTIQGELPPSAPFYALLNGLTLFNLHCGPESLNYLTGDKDYKHIFKRLRSAVLREVGILVNGTLITAALVRHHLASNRVSQQRINSLLNPEDKQDVMLALGLLKEIWELPKPNASDTPTFHRSRTALNILGRVFYHLVVPYIQVSLTLKEQMQHLSAAAHLVLFLYTRSKSKTAFIPTILFNDIMLMVKNAYFCVAKVKIKTPNGTFFIILLGTDRLEISFGILRTMVGNDSNVDVLQICSRLMGVTESAVILALHPEWDRAPRRLRLPALTEKGDLHQKVDHINPASWVGDVRVSSVVLATAWALGRKMVDAELPHLSIDATLRAMQRECPDMDILRPYGSFLFDVDESEDQDLGEESEIEAEVENPVPAEASSTEGTIDALSGLDVEDMLGAEAAKVSPSVNPYLEMPGGKIVHKAKVLTELFKYRRKRESTDRLKRIASLSKYEPVSNDANLIDADSTFGESLLVNDPAAILVRCKGQGVFLAIVQVNQIKIDGRTAESIETSILAEDIVVIGCQILSLVPDAVFSGNGGAKSLDADWRWTLKYDASLKIPGKFIQAINPIVTTVDCNAPTYLFRSDEMRALAAGLFDPLEPSDVALVPEVKVTPTFPYRESDGE